VPANEPQAPTGAEPAPSGPLLSYDVPQGVAYSGQSYIELVLPPIWFSATAQALDTKKVG
jgi:hypothetical protein